MVIAVNPVMASLMARFFFKEQLTKRAWSGIFLGAAGVCIISFVKGTDGSTIGFVAMLLASMSIAIYFVFQKPYFSRYSPLAMTAYTCWGGTIPLLIFLPETITASAAAPPSAISWIVIMGIFSSGVGFIFWIYALSKLQAGTVTSFLFLQPIFVVAMSWLWFGELPGVSTLIGGAVVLAGVGLIVSQSFKPRS